MTKMTKIRRGLTSTTATTRLMATIMGLSLTIQGCDYDYQAFSSEAVWCGGEKLRYKMTKIRESNGIFPTTPEDKDFMMTFEKLCVNSMKYE